MATYDRKMLRARKAAVKKKRLKTPFTDVAKAVAIVRYDMRKFVTKNESSTDHISYMDFIKRWTAALEAIPVSKFFDGEVTDATPRPKFLEKAKKPVVKRTKKVVKK